MLLESSTRAVMSGIIKHERAAMLSGVCVLGADLLQMVIWLTPAGTVDNGGMKQPAYLNFELSLLGPPAANEMQVSHPFSFRKAASPFSDTWWSKSA